MLERRIEVYSSSERYEAVAKDVDAAGHLLVQKDSGELCVLMAGEISIKIVGEPK
jgi:biotin-(acetyl-CoA carboxylase) ligase